MISSACAKRTERSGEHGMPASWTARPKPAATAATSGGIVGSCRQQRGESALAHVVLVLAVLQDGTQRARRRCGVEALGAKGLQRGDPVDRLGDAWALLDVLAAQPADRAGDL